MAWQAKHLLNEVLPAARSASCAIAPDAAIVAAMTIRALEVSFFMRCSSSFPEKRFGPGLWHGPHSMDKPRKHDGFHTGWAGALLDTGSLPKRARTCLICRHKIDPARG